MEITGSLVCVYACMHSSMRVCGNTHASFMQWNGHTQFWAKDRAELWTEEWTSLFQKAFVKYPMKYLWWSTSALKLLSADLNAITEADSECKEAEIECVACYSSNSFMKNKHKYKGSVLLSVKLSRNDFSSSCNCLVQRNQSLVSILVVAIIHYIL